MREGSPEVSRRFPHGIVQISRAFADRAVKLGRDEARLLLHEQRIVLSGLEEHLLVRLNRQNVQRIINDRREEGLVAFEANPHHRRAQLVVLADKGRRTFDAAMRLQAPWINSLSDGLLVKDIETVHRVMTSLRKKLEGDHESEKQA